MKRIIYFHQYFNVPTMGGSVRSFELAMEMSKKYHVTVISSVRNASNNRVKTQYISSSFKIIWIPNRYSNMMNFGSRMLSFVVFVLKAVRYSITEKADIVISTSTPLTIAIPGLLHKIRFRSRFIFEVRDSWPKVPVQLGLLNNKILIVLAKSLEKLTYRYADHVVALSPGMAADVRDVHSKTKVTVIPNFCNNIIIESITPYRFPNEIESGGKIILYAGTFGYVNNMEYIVDLAAALREYDYKFVLVGDGKCKVDTISYAQKLGVLNLNLFIYDAVDKDKIYSMIKRSDAMISTVIDHPVMWANSANKFFDSLVFLKPVIINHKGWLADLILDNNIGLVLEPFVASDVADKVSNMFDISPAEMSTRVGKLSRGEFSFRSIYKKYETVLGGDI
ncbi:MAG: glycosyltransferase family 4 protein [Bacteroidetes bacterium]|nr:glycosyltransferase family 4 protein [Bacteroidota bacterium]